jgi:hypothetical protein
MEKVGFIMTESRPPLPPFTLETAIQKVQAAEDAWNTCDPDRVAQAYTVDSHWRNRDVHIVGRDHIVAFLTRKWQRELDYVLRKSLWPSTTTASPSDSNTSATTRPASGIAATATSSGNSPSPG